jgi:predicted permease
VLTFLVLLCLGTLLLFGLVPALIVSDADSQNALNAGSRTIGTRRARRWTGAFLTVQVVLTLVLLMGAGLMTRSFLAISQADAIVDTTALLATSVTLPNAKYPTPEDRLALYERLQERLNAVGPIAHATLTNRVPFIGAPLRQLSIDGRDFRGGSPPTVTYTTIGAQYFETLGLPLLQGRSFTSVDGTPGHDTAIVNQRFVSLFFPNENPLGHRVRLSAANAAGPASAWLTIVGVSPTVRQQFMTDLDPVVYLPHRADPAPNAWLMVRGLTDRADLTSLLREELRAVDPDLPVRDVASMEALMMQSRWGHSVFGAMFVVIASLALVLSAIGLYAVIAHSVSRRTQEIGLRVALGAVPSQVRWLFVRQGLLPLGLGLAVGIAAATGVGRLIQSMLVQTSPTDIFVLGATSMLLVGVALAACFFPAWRAARLDPILALRDE